MIHYGVCRICDREVEVSEVKFDTKAQRIYVSFTCGHRCVIVPQMMFADDLPEEVVGELVVSSLPPDPEDEKFWGSHCDDEIMDKFLLNAYFAAFRGWKKQEGLE